MDEEILEGTEQEETEVINYDVMMYDLDEQGYIYQPYFGCSSGTCIEYTGKIPEGYDSLEEWYEDNFETIRAWKIVDGNLVLDTNKETEILNKCEIQTEENAHATHKWVNDKLKNINEIYDDELSSTVDGSSLFTIDNTKKTEVVSAKVTPNELIKNNFKFYISNENMLVNKGISETISGIEFKVNEDKSITLNGTSTEEIEFILNGSLNNQETLFFLKKDTNYMQCGLKPNVSINMYSYDGTDRELVSSKGNETININETKYITCVSLKIASGKKFEDVTIYPMITIGTYQEKQYVIGDGKLTNINLGNYKFNNNTGDYIEINRSDVDFHKFVNLYPSKKLFPSKTLFPMKNKEEIINGVIDSLITFEGITIVQSDKDVNLELQYFPKDYLNEKFSKIEIEQDNINIAVGEKVGKDEVIASINASIEEEQGSLIQINADKIKLEGYTTINDGFSVDEQGNMSCNGATANNLNIIGGSIKLTDNGTSSGLVLTSESDLSKIGIWSCGFYVEGKNVPEAEITEDMYSELGFYNGNMRLLLRGDGGYSSELTNYDLAFMSTDNDMTSINSHGIQTPKITGDNNVLIIDSKINSSKTYNNTSTGTVNMHITANGYIARSTSSSERYKKNIKEVSNEELDVNKLLEVPIRQYKYRDNYINKDDERYGKDIIGFIVEELEKYYPIAVDHNEDGTPEMWNSQIMIPAMLKLIQNQAKRIDELEKKVSDK